jgi:hypothetical protein
MYQGTCFNSILDTYHNYCKTPGSIKTCASGGCYEGFVIAAKDGYAEGGWIYG